jgi:hypothetical protein
VGTFVRGLGNHSAPLPQRRQELARLADRFLGAAAVLGFGADEAIDVLRSRGVPTEEETFDA